MVEETNTPEEDPTQDDWQLRDRIVKIETIINYHDREFRDIKTSMGDLSTKVDQHQTNILAVLDEHQKKTMDAQYGHYREAAANTQELKDAIDANKTKFETFVGKWSFGIKAVWIAIAITVSVMIWVFTAGQDLGIVTVNPIAEQLQE